MTAHQQARLVTLEGIDGAGKSTHLHGIGDYLRARGARVVVSREPGGSELAEALRALLLERQMAVLTELLIVFAARKDHLDRVILPALARGDWVVCDRFTDATWAYQGGGRGVPSAQIAWLEDAVQGPLRPMRTYWFDLAPGEAAQRLALARAQEARGRNQADRFEAEDLAFFTRVHKVYAQRAVDYPDTYCRLDAMLARDELAGRIQADLENLLLREQARCA